MCLFCQKKTMKKMTTSWTTILQTRERIEAWPASTCEVLRENSIREIFIVSNPAVEVAKCLLWRAECVLNDAASVPLGDQTIKAGTSPATNATFQGSHQSRRQDMLSGGMPDSRMSFAFRNSSVNPAYRWHGHCATFEGQQSTSRREVGAFKAST